MGIDCAIQEQAGDVVNGKWYAGRARPTEYTNFDGFQPWFFYQISSNLLLSSHLQHEHLFGVQPCTLGMSV
jgi:hypothetical protein